MRTLGSGATEGTIRRFGQGVTYGTGTSAKQLQDWRLATKADNAAVIAAGYFDTLAPVMQVGELIFASIDLDGTPAGKVYMVTANTGSAVTVASI